MTFVTFLKSITLCKNCCGIYLGNFWKRLGFIFIIMSGHTGSVAVESSLVKLDTSYTVILLPMISVLCSKFQGKSLFEWLLLVIVQRRYGIW